MREERPGREEQRASLSLLDPVISPENLKVREFFHFFLIGLTILPKAEPETTREPKGRKLEPAHKREKTVDAKEEVVDPHVLDVDHRHDQLLVLVLQQLGLHHV